MTQESMAIGKIESNYCRNKRNTIYTALEDVENVEWFWSKLEIKRFDDLWNANVPLTKIAKLLERTYEDVFLLSLDRGMKGSIKPRNWKIW